MGKKFLFILFGIIIIFPWISQAFFPGENIWGPIIWDAVALAILLIILKWGRP